MTERVLGTGAVGPITDTEPPEAWPIGSDAVVEPEVVVEPDPEPEDDE
jgi:hypothetical protein